MRFSFITCAALCCQAFNAFAAEYQPETVGSSDIYLDIPEVVTEYNKQYNYTASVDKNNGGGFLTKRDYKGFSTSDSAKSHLNSSYIQFSASLTTSDVTCSNTNTNTGATFSKQSTATRMRAGKEGSPKSYIAKSNKKQYH